MRQNLARLVADDGGATSVEYGIILAGVAALIIVVVALLGGKVRAIFTDYNDSVP